MKTTEDRRQEVIGSIKSLLHYFGGEVVFKRPIRYRATPHANTLYINSVSLDTCFDGMGDELNSINQKLKWMKYEDSQNRGH